MRPPPSHRATTANLQAVYPFVSEGPIGDQGPLVGRDVLGAPFSFDPWELYRAGRLTNPNILVLGQVGRGKSSFVKALVWREVAFGRRAWIIDPKGEYGALAEASGSSPVDLAPGGPVRLNPLDGPGGARNADPDAALRARVELVASLTASSLRRGLQPDERTALELGVRQVSRRAAAPTLPDLVEALFRPDADAAASVGTDVAGLTASGRAPALELRRMIHGDLAGMFDGPTTAGLDPDAAVTVLDLSATFTSSALPLVMTCATAWLQSGLGAGRGGKTLVVMDEAWAILSDPATARWAQATFKLSRSLGVANVVVVHRVSDLRAAGADGSAEEKLAAGLLADAETRVVFGQSPAEAAATGQLLGLSRTEVEAIAHLPRAIALWRVGARAYLVEHHLGRHERALVDTDAAMRR
ncbi:MAG TPA: ATP-binding protein [Acidimicrobiales bacterium]|nr:ATP-binding protein [Acidimicrobiales bacterium]